MLFQKAMIIGSSFRLYSRRWYPTSIRSIKNKYSSNPAILLQNKFLSSTATADSLKSLFPIAPKSDDESSSGVSRYIVAQTHSLIGRKAPTDEKLGEAQVATTFQAQHDGLKRMESPKVGLPDDRKLGDVKSDSVTPPKDVDETNWIWTTGKMPLKRMKKEQLIQFCQDTILPEIEDKDYSSPSPYSSLKNALQRCTESPKFRNNLINNMINLRNVRRKEFPPAVLKAFKVKSELRTPEEVEFFNAHSTEEIQRLCRDYGVVQARKTRAQKVRALLKQKKIIDPEEEAILRDHGKDLIYLCNEWGLSRAGNRNKKLSKLSQARKLNRIRKMNLLIHSKLLFRAKEGGTTLDPELQVSDDLAWKDQLYVYFNRKRIRKIYEACHLEWRTGYQEKKRVKLLRQLCRLLKIKWNKL